MFTKLQVVNDVASELGRDPVSVITERPDTQIISNKLDILLPELLLVADWNFAIIFRKDTTPLTTNFTPDFAYTFQLPANVGRITIVQTAVAYQIFDRLLCIDSNQISYYYIANDVDYGVLPPTFERALVFYCASVLSPQMTNNKVLTEYLTNAYKAKIGEAVETNQMQNPVVGTPNDYDRIFYI